MTLHTWPRLKENTIKTHSLFICIQWWLVQHKQHPTWERIISLTHFVRFLTFFFFPTATIDFSSSATLKSQAFRTNNAVLCTHGEPCWDTVVSNVVLFKSNWAVLAPLFDQRPFKGCNHRNTGHYRSVRDGSAWVCLRFWGRHRQRIRKDYKEQILIFILCMSFNKWERFWFFFFSLLFFSVWLKQRGLCMWVWK